MTIERQEAENVQKSREIERIKLLNHHLETKYELLKTKMQDVTSNMTSQVAYTIDEMREELAQVRSLMVQMTEEYESSMSEVKRVFAKINR